ncbi:MAG: hypothetical protein R3A52_25340 [Polyangiales bacterium]
MRTTLMILALAAYAAGCANFSPESSTATLGVMRACEGRWTTVDVSGPAPREWVTVTRTPRGAVIFGGRADTELSDGWRYDGAFAPLAREGQPSPRAGHAAAWSRDRLCVWGGEAGRSPLDDGACWIAADDRWVAMSTEGAPSARAAMAFTATAGGVFVFGGRDAEDGTFDDGATYDVSSDRWTALAPRGPRARYNAVAAALSSGVLVWGGAGEALALGAEDAAIFSAGAWRSVDVSAAPAVREGPGAAALDDGLLVWGRERCAWFDGATASWVELSAEGMPSPRWGASVVVTPTAVVVWGGRDEAGLRGDGACWDRASRRWVALPTEGAPSPRADAVALEWGGRVLILWGRDDGGLRGDAYALELR